MSHSSWSHGSEKPMKGGTSDALFHMPTEAPAFSHPEGEEHRVEIKSVGSKLSRHGLGL